MQASDFYRAYLKVKKAVTEKNFDPKLYLKSHKDALFLSSVGPTSYAQARVKADLKITGVCMPMEFGELFEGLTGEVSLTEKGNQLLISGAMKGKANIISQDVLSPQPQPREYYQVHPDVKQVVYAGDGEVHLHNNLFGATNTSRFAGYACSRNITPDVVSFPARVLGLIDEECAIGVGAGKLWIVDSNSERGFSIRTGNINVLRFAYEPNLVVKAECLTPRTLVGAVKLSLHFGGKGWLEYRRGTLTFSPVGSELGTIEAEPIPTEGTGEFRVPVSSQYLLDALSNMTEFGRIILQEAATVQGTTVEVLRLVTDNAQHFIPLDASLLTK